MANHEEQKERKQSLKNSFPAPKKRSVTLSQAKNSEIQQRIDEVIASNWSSNIGSWFIEDYQKQTRLFAEDVARKQYANRMKEKNRVKKLRESMR